MVFPASIRGSEWPRIRRRLASMAVEFDPWQVGACRVSLGLDEDGKYASTVGGVTWSIPRQVGKTFTLGALLIAMCIEYPGLRVVWTAHHLRTSTLTFRSMQGMVKRPKVAPHLAEGRNDGIRTANGEQEIAFRNGSIIMFGARATGFGRGFDAIDVVVFDEGQILGEKALEDIVATTNQARHVHGALLFFIGTPPRPDDDSEAFTNKRRKALAGKLRNGVYIECSADPAGDMDDPEQVMRANPSVPDRTPWEAVERLRENLTSDDAWRREGMGVWDEFDSTDTTVFDEPDRAMVWADAGLPNLPVPDGLPSPRAVGIGVSLDAQWSSLCTAGVLDDGRILLGLTDRRRGTSWLAAEAKRIQEQHRVPVLIDEKCPDASLIEALRAAGVNVTALKYAEVAEATSALIGEVREGSTVHLADPDLDGAVQRAVLRNITDGQGRPLFGRKSSLVQIDPLEGVLAAHRGVVGVPDLAESVW